MKHETLPNALQNFTVDVETGCWLWTAAMLPNGYGAVSINGTTYGAHRAMFEHLHGPIGHLVVHHKCHNRRCVNPDHLEAMPQHIHGRLRRGVRLVPSDVHRIRYLQKYTSLSSRSIAELLALPGPAVGQVLKGNNWRSVVTGEAEENRCKQEMADLL